ncbi:proline-rich receptor-like protein kinase PERK2 [Iris pallida]|uniref:Proline-rich receptor-like protein kinase PERK2 n=1 Tax=Iris pallida TaxID=29817 RepID=A0AAX6EVJ9_IRIPA|nr:proline-rich receptor-like protein kinase PERK2 [Iris pallida]
MWTQIVMATVVCGNGGVYMGDGGGETETTDRPSAGVCWFSGDGGIGSGGCWCSARGWWTGIGGIAVDDIVEREE